MQESGKSVEHMLNTIFICTIIILIIAFGFVMRFQSFPTFPELHADEAGFGYSTYSWLKTGMDEYSRPPGLLLESLGDWKLALYAYILYPLIAIFGLHDWVVRLPSLLFGVLTIPLLYVLTKRMFAQRSVAAVSALVVWILPWHMIFSRTGNEVTMELFFLLAGVYFFLRWQQEAFWRWLVLASMCFVLSVLSYYPSFVTVPLIVISLMLLYWPRTMKRQFGIVLPLLCMCAILALFVLTQPKDRIAQTSFLNSEGPQAVLFERISESGMGQLPVIVTKALHNKYTVGFHEFLTRFFAHFDWRYWFTEGEIGNSRYDVPYQGPLYLWMTVFLLLGVVVSSQHVRSEDWQSYALVFIWIVAGMVPGAMTIESANLQRSFLAIPGLVWLMALGSVYAWKYVSTLRYHWRMVLFGAFLLLFVFHSFYYYVNYFLHQQFRRPWGRHAYVVELVAKLEQYHANFDKTYVGELPYLPMLYYTKAEPAFAQAMLREHQYKRDSATAVRKYGMYESMSIRCPRAGQANVLYACKGAEVPYHSRVIDVVRYRDGIPAYTLIELLVTNDPRVNEPKPDRVTILSGTDVTPSIHELPNSYW